MQQRPERSNGFDPGFLNVVDMLDSVFGIAEWLLDLMLEGLGELLGVILELLLSVLG